MEERHHKPKVVVTRFSEDAVSKVIHSLEEIESLYSPNQSILIQIDSYGGAVDGLAMLYDKIKGMSNPIITYTSSKAMSAGAILLATAANKGMRIASPEATIMIHEVQAGTGGDIKDMEDQMALTKMLNDRWMKILAKSMGLKGASDIRALIKKKAIGHDIYLTAHQALQLKIVDAVASIKMTPFHGWNFVALPPKR